MSQEVMNQKDASKTNTRKETIALGILVVALLFAIGVCILMTWHHESQLYGNTEGELIGCKSDETTNCDVVNTSAYATVFGIPIATWGIAAYSLALFWTGMALRGRRQFLKPLIGLGLITSVYSVFLFIISKTELNYVCSWCIRLYLVNFAILILPAFARFKSAPWPTKRGIAFSALTWLIVAILSIGAQQLYHRALAGESSIVDKNHLEKKKAEANAKIKDEFDEKGNFIDPKGDLSDYIATKKGISDQADQKGDLSIYEVEVKTEDKNTATLSLSKTDPWKGSLDAKVVIVEFADFECPYCKRMASQLSELYDAYKADAIFIYKHFPLDKACNPGSRSRKHRKACSAALASVCAQQQGRFWAYHDILYKNQHAIDAEDLKLYAQKMGLDMDRFKSCLNERQSRNQMRIDTEMGKSLDIHGTPRLFINGKLYRSGSSTQQLAYAIEKALGSTDAAKKSKAFLESNVIYTPIAEDIQPEAQVSLDDLSFSIDTFEASIENETARSGKNRIPATRTSWYTAKSACEKAGKRLCTEQEWVSACQNAKAIDDDDDGQFADDMAEGSSYAYGEQHDPKRCWTAKKRDSFRPVYTGEMPGCVNDNAVYDLIGNVSEWVGLEEKDAVLMGGAYDTPKDKARCYRRNDTYGPGYANLRTGFRCCSGKAPTSNQ